MLEQQTITNNLVNPLINDFAQIINSKANKGELAKEKANDFLEFLSEVEQNFLQHSIVTKNNYTNWFEKGEVTLEALRYFTIQFSVFSNQFLIAQLKKMINAESLAAMRSAKEILANEIGVVFRNQSAKKQTSLNEEEKEQFGDPELVSTSGSIDGGVFRFTAGHFEWLLNFASALGLAFNDIGKPRHANETTKFFCDELCHIYGSEDANIAAGASFAIENWAAAGFWQQLVDGLAIIKQNQIPKLPLAFFTWHNRLESQHAGNTFAELETIFFEPNFDKEKFLTGGIAMLNALEVFWNGLFINE